MEKIKYNIGLDIGTSSVGWAVVESDTQKIIKKGNFKTSGNNNSKMSLWGVRLFDSANTAEVRRNFRLSRRRYDRRRERIKHLQDIFSEEICKVDNTFFEKLKSSFISPMDVNNKKYSLTEYDKKYIFSNNIIKQGDSKKYPTIYHLRNELVNSKEKMDIRLIYLAIHHIIKYRGNFLREGSTFNVSEINIDSLLEEVFNQIKDTCTEVEYNDISEINYKDIEKHLLLKSVNDRKVEIKNDLKEIFNEKFISEFLKMMNGYKFDIKRLFNLDLEDKISISFDQSDYDEAFEKISSIIEDKIEIINNFKNIYDSLFLKKLFGSTNKTNLSSLMIDKYMKHSKDLKLLKGILKSNKKKYKEFFKEDNCKYEQYLKNKISKEDFYKLVVELDENNELQDEISKGEFLPKITSTDNGRFPYQLNKNELISIIENQGEYYPFLKEKIGNTYKIVKLLEFKIPYYVGPLNKNSKFSWIEKNDNEKITPYNFEEIVNKDLTAEKFIKRMISHCTYLLDEEALPNSSIAYSKYKVYNELKQIKVNDSRLDVTMINIIYKELFLKKSGIITDKIFKEFLLQTGQYSMDKDISVTGYSSDNKFANNMQSYVDFFGENGFFKNTKYTEDDADKIIEWCTIFEDKDILKNKIKKEYVDLDDKIVNSISTKKYKGWGNLSKKLLYAPSTIIENKPVSIMDLLINTDENFMQIINNDEYNIDNFIKENNKLLDTTRLSYDVVDQLATSPSVKRGIYQSLKIVKELVEYIGYNPNMICIEMAREDQQKKRTQDRKRYLKELYKNISDFVENLNQLNDELDKFEKIDTEKLFLYFIQEGKSLYSGKPLDIEHLSDYEVDHILPRSIIKDDSIDNKALVLREENQNKKNALILPSAYNTEINRKWWNHLKKNKLISSSKFYRLTRKEYSDDDIAGFINRQLVETRQITKHVAHILENYYKDSTIVYLKANVSHLYRDKFHLYKFREINDFHHTYDAYLAAILGEYTKTKLRSNINYRDLIELIKNYSETNEELKYGYIINTLDSRFGKYDVTKDGEVIENRDKLLYIENFNKMAEYNYYRNDILYTKKTEIKTGEFYNQTIYNKNEATTSLKSNLIPSLYGGYKSLNPSYAVIIKYTKKGKEYQKLIGIPIYIDKQKRNKNVLNDYIFNLLNLDKENDQYTILRNSKNQMIKIPFYSKINWDGQICSLVGATATVEVCNSKELTFTKLEMKKYMMIFNKLYNDPKIEIDNYSNELNNIIFLIINKIENEYKLYSNLVDSLKDSILVDELTENDKETLIKELLNLLSFNSKNANLKIVNLSSAFGKKHSRIIEHAKLYQQSVTGIKEKIYEF